MSAFDFPLEEPPLKKALIKVCVSQGNRSFSLAVQGSAASPKEEKGESRSGVGNSPLCQESSKVGCTAFGEFCL